MLLFNHSVDDETQKSIVGSKDFVAVRANHIVHIAREVQLLHVLRIGIKHTKDVAVERSPLQFTLGPYVEFRHRLFVQLKVRLLDLIG
ncbi:hypothetical protein AQ727_27740 [Burkholderia pseudomallei]|nr:hypothetical protein AQ727_27740 [Burkholderia pseudomallei]